MLGHFALRARNFLRLRFWEEEVLQHFGRDGGDDGKRAEVRWHPHLLIVHHRGEFPLGGEVQRFCGGDLFHAARGNNRQFVRFKTRTNCKLKSELNSIEITTGMSKLSTKIGHQKDD